MRFSLLGFSLVVACVAGAHVDTLAEMKAEAALRSEHAENMLALFKQAVRDEQQLQVEKRDAARAAHEASLEVSHLQNLASETSEEAAEEDILEEDGKSGFSTIAGTVLAMSGVVMAVLSATGGNGPSMPGPKGYSELEEGDQQPL